MSKTRSLLNLALAFALAATCSMLATANDNDDDDGGGGDGGECVVPNDGLIIEGTTECVQSAFTVFKDYRVCFDPVGNGPGDDDDDDGGGGGPEGCTPGYWKQSQHFFAWTAPYAPDTLFSDVFENAYPGKTLLEVLQLHGGHISALGRHTVAALLNAASPDVAYDLTVAEVITLFNDVYPGSNQDYNDLKDYFETFNEQGCPLGNDKDDDGKFCDPFPDDGKFTYVYKITNSTDSVVSLLGIEISILIAPDAYFEAGFIMGDGVEPTFILEEDDRITWFFGAPIPPGEMSVELYVISSLGPDETGFSVLGEFGLDCPGICFGPAVVCEFCDERDAVSAASSPAASVPLQPLYGSNPASSGLPDRCFSDDGPGPCFVCPTGPAGPGDCCAANGTPGCEDQVCELEVCAVDPACCDIAWDMTCADQAWALCDVCAAPATIDDCEGALAISGEGLFDFDLTAATNSGPDHAACEAFGSGAIDNDHWYCWTAPCDAFVEVQTCDLTDVDTKIAVYDGCGCPVGDADLLDCGDDFCGLQSRVAFNAVAGGQYLFRIGTFPGASGGVGQFDVNCIELGVGDCCASNGTPGCEDLDCESLICGVDPFCCDTEWDQQCADLAFELCDVCSNFGCRPAGNGDDCAGPIHIGEGTFAGDTTDNTGALDDSSCAFNDIVDEWYCYVPSCSGIATASTCDDADFDTTITIFDACDGTELACNDDGAGCGGFTSEVSWPVVGGVTYQIRVAGFNGAVGTYNLSVSCATATDNNDCANAEPIEGQGVFNFDNGAATTDGVADPLCDAFGSQQVDNDVWFCWTAPCTSAVQVQTCGGTAVDTKIAVYDGCGCPSGNTILDCNDDSCGLQSTVTFEAVAGNQYLIRIGTFPGAAGGTGTFEITCFAGVNEPGADNWQDAVALDVSPLNGVSMFMFDNTSATTDGVADVDCDAFGSQQIDNDVWFCWTASCTGTITLETCGGTGVDTKIAVYRGCGSVTGDNGLLACNDDSCGLQSSVSFVAGEGTGYLIRIGTFPGATGGLGAFTVTCPSPAEEPAVEVLESLIPMSQDAGGLMVPAGSGASR